MADNNGKTTHVCDADCWAHMLRYGASTGCDPFVARAAADRELASIGH